MNIWKYLFYVHNTFLLYWISLSDQLLEQNTRNRFVLMTNKSFSPCVGLESQLRVPVWPVSGCSSFLVYMWPPFTGAQRGGRRGWGEQKQCIYNLALLCFPSCFLVLWSCQQLWCCLIPSPVHIHLHPGSLGILLVICQDKKPAHMLNRPSFKKSSQCKKL